MAALTGERNTQELHVGAVKYNYAREVASGKIYAGSLVAQNANGKAVPASDAANLLFSAEPKRQRARAKPWKSGAARSFLTTAKRRRRKRSS